MIVVKTSEESLLDHVAGHAGPEVDPGRVVEDVLAAISPALDDASRELVASELPPRFAQIIRRRGGKPLLLRGKRLEVAASACRVLAEELSDEAVEILRRALPPPLSGWLVPGAPEGREPVAVEISHATFAEGRPGSASPVAEARRAGAQSASVAEANPHAGTKLSSSSGLTQEREHETLAEGQPGSTRPVSERDRR